MDALEALAILALTAVMSAVAFRRGFLTKDGAAAAFISACIIGMCGSIWWLLAYVVFPAVAFAATMMDIGRKEEKGLQEGKKGERSAMNILGVGLAPAVISLANFADSAFGGGDASDLLACAFISAVAVSVADTISSEIGVLDGKVWMITTMKRTEPGINGGISRLGLASSTVMSFAYALIGWILIFGEIDALFLIPAVCGVIGNLLDSVVGAVLENKGRISKYGNNFVTAMAGGIIGYLLFFLAT
ncbi:MAG: DUF92 domain-containing protein [Candidatus Methanomethylophilus sp.]|jgi:uncharacterized protein (TIGR00297 family)|nr:DUF92 domain-containing protein [Methanomethylophilus sp.]MCI2075690.1 DUF92 domain-containing protein [Methanomethylophilus sp.]MCI2093900.1 DUF92 domain-containing protein [Methanomethylophilus sp.]